MIPVHIRRADDSESVRIGEVPFTEAALDGVIPLLARWGVIDGDGEELNPNELVGQFVITPATAYFEVVFATDDPAPAPPPPRPLNDGTRGLLGPHERPAAAS